MHPFGIMELTWGRDEIDANFFKCIFLDENAWIPFKISLQFVPKGWINNIPALVQILACRRPDGKPLSEPMVVNLLTFKRRRGIMITL